MNLRWELYNLDPTGNMYDINDYGTAADITPINTSSVKFTWKKEGVRKRHYMDSPLIFKCTDYDLFYNSKGQCGTKVIICKRCGSSDIFWKGFVDFSSLEFDEDNRIATVKCEVFDEYSWLLSQKKVEYNILNMGTALDVLCDFGVSGSYDFRVLYETDPQNPYYINENGDRRNGNFYKFTTYPDDPITEYPIWWEFPVENEDVGVGVIPGISVWARHKRYSESIEGIDCWNQSQIPPSYSYLETTYVGGVDMCVYVGRPGTANGGLSDQNCVMTNDCDDGYPTPPSIPPDPTFAGNDKGWIELRRGCYDDLEDGDDIVNIFTYNLNAITVEEYGNVRYLRDIIRGIIDGNNDPNGLEYQSMFFNSRYDMMKGGFFSNVRNIRQNMMIAHKSDIRLGVPYISWGQPESDIDHATKGIITFERLMDILKVFNVDWYINESGFFEIEHIKYFENGNNYLGTGFGVGKDVTGEDYAQNLNSYKYIKGELFKYEKFKFMEQRGLDFVGLPITYGVCANQDPDTNVIEHSFNELTTDITFIHEDEEAISREGFVLLMYYKINDNIWVAKERGYMTESTLPNVHLSWANLHDNYWKYGRIFSTGYINGAWTTFSSYIKNIEQVDVSYPLCCEEFEPYKLITTSLGDGEIFEATLDAKTGWITVKLRYND